jgi:hypothetical protein
MRGFVTDQNGCYRYCPFRENDCARFTISPAHRNDLGRLLSLNYQRSARVIALSATAPVPNPKSPRKRNRSHDESTMF